MEVIGFRQLRISISMINNNLLVYLDIGVKFSRIQKSSAKIYQKTITNVLIVLLELDLILKQLKKKINI